MWEGKAEEEEQAAQPSEPKPELAVATEENEFNDDDEFGDDFDDFAEGQEADDDFGDFDQADETPMAAEPQSPVQTQRPGLLAGLVSSMQINVYLKNRPNHADMCLSAITEFHHSNRHRLFDSTLSRLDISQLQTNTKPICALGYHRRSFPF